MLECIKCGFEQTEKFNVIQCPKCSGEDELHNYLYSTTFRSYKFDPSPLEQRENFWLKREDKNLASGTFKDRKAMCVAEHSLPNAKFALASSGNMAIAWSKLHRITFMRDRTYLYVSPNIDFKKLQILKECYKEIEFTNKILTTADLTKEEPDRWNITNGMDPIGASAYYQLGFELEPFHFDNIIVPCGSGELYSALAVYFHILRKKHPRIIPVTSKLPEADAINTEFVACQPFIDWFEDYYEGGDQGLEYVNDAERLKYYSDLYNCELSSAVVFVAGENLRLKGKTCFMVTGAKR